MEEAHRRARARSAVAAGRARRAAPRLSRTVFMPRSPRRVRSTSASKSGRSCGRRPRRRPAAARSTVCSSPRATGPVSARLGAERDPVVHGRAHERREQAPRLRRLEAGVARDLLRHRLERDEEVRRHRRGGVVGGALVVAAARTGPSRAASAIVRGGLERLGRRAGDRAADARAGRASRRPRTSGAGGSRRRARRRAAGRSAASEVAPLVCPTSARRAGDGLRGGRDLRVGHAQQDHVARGDLAAPGGPATSYPASRSAADERRAETALSDYSECHGGEVRSPAAE